MTIQEARGFLEKQDFTFAKSYAKTYPHFYLQRAKASDEKKYEEFIRLIREKGEVYHFHKKQYIYLEIDGFVYWEMGRPIKCVQVLNKATKQSLNNQFKANDYISKQLKTKLKEREEYLEQLLSKKHKTAREENQIRFLMNTQRRIHGGGKNIIDKYNQKVIYE